LAVGTFQDKVALRRHCPQPISNITKSLVKKTAAKLFMKKTNLQAAWNN